MGKAPSEKETQREGMAPRAPLAAYRYFGRCDRHGRVEIDAPGKHWPPTCPLCDVRLDHNRVTRMLEAA